jgi:rhamnose utilization protein RhaD (predicted bifunctional aldolase and dehydrogenase)
MHIERPWPPSLDEHAFRLGSDINLVQGTGGNVSMKLDGVLWVKGSGQYLKKAREEEIFLSIPLDLYSKTEVLNNSDFVLNTNETTFKPFMQLRPSIETNFHLLIERPIVSHVHSKYAITIGVLRNADSLLKEIFVDMKVLFVPYARPGKKLAQAIYSRIQESGEDFQALILGNHGLITVGDTFAETEWLISNIEGRLKEYLEKTRLQSNTRSSFKEILCHGVLTPDESVFLGEVPFSTIEDSYAGGVKIDDDGNVHYPGDFADSKRNVVEFYQDIARILTLIASINSISFINPLEVKELVTWDKEIYRNAII